MSKRKGDPGYAAGWCIHYRARDEGGKIFPKTCEAGVEYAQFKAGEFRATFAQQPCFLTEAGESKPGALPCSCLRRPTAEEIALHEAWVAERMDRIRKVMLGIRPWREKHRGRGHAEVVECPACKGRLHLSISAYNGHVHGRCETDDCVSWME